MGMESDISWIPNKHLIFSTHLFFLKAFSLYLQTIRWVKITYLKQTQSSHYLFVRMRKTGYKNINSIFFPLRSPSTNLTKLTSKDLFAMRHQKSISKCLGDGLCQWLPVPSHVVSSRWILTYRRVSTLLKILQTALGQDYKNFQNFVIIVLSNLFKTETWHSAGI